MADVKFGGPLSHLDRKVDHVVSPWRLRYRSWPRRALTIGLWFGQRGTVFVGSSGLALWLSVRNRTAEPLLRLVVAFACLVLAVYLLKYGVARNAPIDDARGRLARSGTSFPSGHAANAVALWGWAAYVTTRWPTAGRLRTGIRWGRAMAPIAVLVTMTLLDYHWLSDLIAGLALGVLVLRVASADCWTRVATPAAPNQHSAAPG